MTSNAPAANPTSPLTLFAEWMAEAKTKEINDPNAMCLATQGVDGIPDARMVLLKDYDESGFCFYTNRESAKGEELAQTPAACLLFHWKSLRRQVRIRGNVQLVSDAESDAYFATRPHGSQVGAWASQQSRSLSSRAALLADVARIEARFIGQSIPRPPNWGGYRLIPLHIEFWQDQMFRLHDRIVYARPTTQEAWTTERLYP